LTNLVGVFIAPLFYRISFAQVLNYFAAMEMNLYYDLQHPLWYKRPDWFGVVGVPRWYGGHDMRYSYVVWDEGKPPLIIVELLSAGTEDEDLGQTTPTTDGTPPKWEVYEQILRVPYYVVFGRDSAEMRIFRLTRRRYREVQGHGGRFWLPEAGLGLGQWQGSYDGHKRLWLRWYDAEGEWIPTVEELAAQEREQKEAALLLAAEERQRAEHADQRAARLAELLRQLGHDPDQE
jgi:Uma2 family endonuclease